MLALGTASEDSCAAQDDDEEDDEDDEDDEEDDEEDEAAVQRTVVIKELNHDGSEKADVSPSALPHAVTLHASLLRRRVWLAWDGTGGAASPRAETAMTDRIS